MTPKGARGRAAVHRLGRTQKTGGFAKIEQKARARGMSDEAAKRVAGAVYWNMVRKHRGI